LDRAGVFESSNPFFGTCQPPGYSNEFKLKQNLVEFRDTGKKGKDTEDEVEGDVVYVEESGWNLIVQW
jgi:hypothetical protein